MLPTMGCVPETTTFMLLHHHSDACCSPTFYFAISDGMGVYGLSFCIDKFSGGFFRIRSLAFFMDPQFIVGILCLISF